MNLKDVQKKLLSAAKDLSSLEELVDASGQNTDTQLNIPIFFTEFFYFEKNDFVSGALNAELAKQEKTIVNGAEDCFITRISYTYIAVESLGLPEPLFIGRDVAPESLSFEFRWNFRVASTQARYLSQANSVSLLSRRSLGFLDAGLPLSLAKPLYFAAGDALTLEVEPLSKATEAFGSANGKVVYFTLHGFRNGVMA
jgi:hypothetical protein